MSATRTLGDPLPATLSAFWQALDSARFADAAACFSADAVYAVGRPGVETAPRAVSVGPAAALERFTESGPRPWHHVPLLCVVEGAAALVEGELHDASDRPAATYVCSARIGGGGLLERLVAFSCSGARDPIPTDVDATTEPADAATVVHHYFADLDAGRFADAAARFADDVLYSHPPYRHTGIDDPDRIEFRGRPALEAAFHRRGPTSFDHEVLVTIQRGPHCMLEGAVSGLPDGGTGSFISSLSLAADGTIRRYLSFYCEPAVAFP